METNANAFVLVDWDGFGFDPSGGFPRGTRLGCSMFFWPGGATEGSTRKEDRPAGRDLPVPSPGQRAVGDAQGRERLRGKASTGGLKKRGMHGANTPLATLPSPFGEEHAVPPAAVFSGLEHYYGNPPALSLVKAAANRPKRPDEGPLAAR